MGALPGPCSGLPLGASLGEVLGTAVGILLGLAGLSTALLCLFALGEGALRRGSLGLLAGLLMLAGGLWMVGLLG